MKMVRTIEELKQYLIGNVPDGIAKEIDLKIISSTKLEENLLFAEEAIIEDYLEGELTAEQENLFNKNFLVSQDRFEQVRLIAQLKKYNQISINEGSSTIKDNSKEGNFFQEIVNSVFKRPVIAYGAIIIAGLILLSTWYLIPNNSNNYSDLELEYAKINSQDLTDSNKFSNSKSLIFYNGIKRSNNARNEFFIRDFPKEVPFNIAIRSSTSDSETYKIELIENGEVIFTQRQIKAINNKSGKELRLLMPKIILKPGDYRIRATSNVNQKNKITYQFFVK